MKVKVLTFDLEPGMLSDQEEFVQDTVNSWIASNSGRYRVVSTETNLAPLTKNRTRMVITIWYEQPVGGVSHL